MNTLQYHDRSSDKNIVLNHNRLNDRVFSRYSIVKILIKHRMKIRIVNFASRADENIVPDVYRLSTGDGTTFEKPQLSPIVSAPSPINLEIGSVSAPDSCRPTG